jgi:glutaconyl-CoA/methylmalonyl-CoA decarboxylase subunit delta
MNIDWSVVSNEGVILNSVMTVIIIAALISVYKLFKWISIRFRPNIREKLKSQGKLLRNGNGNHAVPAEHSTAIALALYLNNELHDEESNILTIERVSRIYSPWSSKYYNMRKPPR